MPKPNDTVVTVEEKDEVDVKGTVIRVAAMTVATAAALVATHLVIKQIEKPKE